MKKYGEKGIVLLLILGATAMFAGGCMFSDVFNKPNADKVTAAASNVEAKASAVIAQADSLATAVENSTGKSIDAETAEKLQTAAEKLQTAAEKVASAANAANAVLGAAASATGTTDNSYVSAFNAALIALGGVAGSLVTFFKNRNKTAAATADTGNVTSEQPKTGGE